jgi:hypothetical protein
MDMGRPRDPDQIFVLTDRGWIDHPFEIQKLEFAEIMPEFGSGTSFDGKVINLKAVKMYSMTSLAVVSNDCAMVRLSTFYGSESARQSGYR